MGEESIGSPPHRSLSVPAGPWTQFHYNPRSIIEQGLLDKYTTMIEYDLQRQHTNYDSIFQYLCQYYSSKFIIFVNTAKELIVEKSFIN